MDKKIEQLITELKQVSLTKAERSLLRQQITPPRLRHPSLIKEGKGWWVFASLALLLVIGSGVSLAAEQALPGDPLYSIKTKVNEPVVTWLATTPEKKVAQETKLVEKRLQEAEQLDARQNLTPALKAEVQENVVKQVAKLKAEENQDHKNQSDEQNGQLEQILQKHEQVLEKLDFKDKMKGGGDDVRKGSPQRHQGE